MASFCLKLEARLRAPRCRGIRFSGSNPRVSLIKGTIFKDFFGGKLAVKD